MNMGPNPPSDSSVVYGAYCFDNDTALGMFEFRYDPGLLACLYHCALAVPDFALHNL